MSANILALPAKRCSERAQGRRRGAAREHRGGGKVRACTHTSLSAKQKWARPPFPSYNTAVFWFKLNPDPLSGRVAAVAALAEEAALRGDRRRRSSWPVPRQRPPERRPAPQTRPHAQAPSCTATTPVFAQPVSTARCRSSPPPPVTVEAHARVPIPQHNQLAERTPQRRPCLGPVTCS